ncbi:MAG: V-type ATP synthase subunit I [Clostridia bacterium]|nr:V-type ATP synthase subunit I [Clostridia bacterium]
MSVGTMKKLTVLSYERDADAIVRKLMNLKCVEIRNTSAGEGLTPLSTLEIDTQKSTVERRLADIRAALPTLAKYTSRKGGLGRIVHRVDRAEFCREGRDARAWQTVCDTLATVAQIDALIAERTRNESLMVSVEPWLGYDAALDTDGSAKTQILLGAYPAGTDVLEVREEMENAGVYFEEVSDDGNGVYVVLTFLRTDADSAERLLAARGFSKTAFPEVASTARVAYETAEARLGEIDTEMFGAEERLRDLAEAINDVEILADIEETTLNVCVQKRKLAATRNCAVLSGWVPAEAEERIARTLSAFECACEVSEPEEDEEPPVLLKNNRFAANFEWVIGMYSYPKYGTFDPTFIMSIFYFIIFGMMFADVGYGLLLVLGCFGGIKLLNPKEGMRRMLSMFGYCGISCMIMGVLFGGWFGNLPTAIMNSFIYHADGVAETTAIGKFFYNGLIFNPIDSSTSFLVLALGVGEVHLIAGMAINMIETCKRGKVLEGICSTVPYWVLFAGIDLMVPALYVDMLMPDPSAVSAATNELFALLSLVGKYLMFAGFGLIFLLKGVGQRSFFGWLSKGLGGLYSLISYASDLLSYSRILALGLVAGVIAQVINMLTGMGASGPIGFVFMLIVMILGHVLNLAINLLGTFVHAARLQYIEFFGKFYDDGGEPFSPALPAENYSEDTGDISNEIQ